jgi:transposase
MKPPLSIHHFTDEERAALEAGLRSHDAFRVRRCQIVLASAAGQKPAPIATALHCAPQTVRNVIHAFDERGLACVQRGSNVPISVEPVLNPEKREHVRALLHQSPRNFGKPASVWTLKLLAEACHEQGLSPTTVSVPTMLDAIVRLDVNWKRAKHWIVSPDPAYALKKATRSADPDSRPPSRPRPAL